MKKSAIPFVIFASISVVVGGVVSAASAGQASYTSSWAVAYLVLVGGVAQLVLGLGQAELASKALPTALLSGQVVMLNLANIAVLFGTLLAAPVLTYLGAALLAVALAAFIWAVRGAYTHRTWLLWAFRMMVIVLLVSAPIGLVIAHSRTA